MNRAQRRQEGHATKKAVAAERRPKAKKPAIPIVGGPKVLQYADLNPRQENGHALYERAQQQNGKMILISDEETLWFSQNESTKAYHVHRITKNKRGTLVVEYRCECEDFNKYGVVDCKHIFAEKLRREEIVVQGPVKKTKEAGQKKASRRPARKRKTHDGRAIKTAQRDARRDMPKRIPELTLSLKYAYDQQSKIVIPPRPQKNKGGKKPAAHSSRAMAFVTKVSYGKSASEMMTYFKGMIEDGYLLLRREPAEKTLSEWINDDRLTPVLHELLRFTSLPFREREIGAIVDSSKVSQLMIAHAKEVDYNHHDKRPEADWMKCHALVGVETMVVMAVEFSGVYGKGTHDVNFIKPLVEKAIETFPLEFLLADKAYLTEDMPRWLSDKGMQAVIPLKKGWFEEQHDKERRFYNKPLTHLIEWYRRNENRDFHEVYRLRPKIECLFSLLKRLAGGYCSSRGRKRTAKNANAPCTAWMNEVLCKFIYLNLRATITLEEETGTKIDYRVTERRFPEPSEPLLRRAA